MKLCTDEGCDLPRVGGRIAKCVEHLRTQRRRDYLAHQETRRAAARARSALRHRANPQGSADRMRRWRRANPQRAREANARWAASHPDYIREKCRLRRVARSSVPFVLTLDLDGCAICGGPLRPEFRAPHPLSSSVGHEPPLAVARRDGWLTVIERPEHLGCNQRKGSRVDADLPRELFSNEFATGLA